MKRLSIAVEIIALQKMIILDEPTSGLDSSIALEIMTEIKQLVIRKDQQRICLSTIHQPSKELFSLFDKVILLCMGRVIFYGNTNQVIEYFSQPKLGYNFKGKGGGTAVVAVVGIKEIGMNQTECEENNKNPAEIILDICCGKILSEGSHLPKQAEELEILFKTSHFYTPSELYLPSGKNTKRIDNHSYNYSLLLDTCYPSKQPHQQQHSPYQVTSIYTQVTMLFHRSWTAKLRNIQSIKFEVFYRILVGLLFGIVFFGKGDVEEPLYENGIMSSDARSYNSLLNLIMSMILFTHISAISALVKNFQVYKRELASNTYSTMSLFIAEVFALIPWHLFLHTIFMVIVYLMTMMKNDAEYFFYLLFISFLATYISYSIALILAFSFSEQVAFTLYQLNFMFVLAFAGFMIHVNDIPIVIQWISYIVYSRWCFEGMMVNEWNMFETDDDINDDNERNGNGNILKDFGFDNYSKNNSIGLLFMFLSIYLFIYYLILNSSSDHLVKEEKETDYFTVLPPSTCSGITTNSDSSNKESNNNNNNNEALSININPMILQTSKNNSKMDANHIKYVSIEIDNSNNTPSKKMKRNNSVFELEKGLLDNQYLQDIKPVEDIINDPIIVYEPQKDVNYFYTKSISITSITKYEKSKFIFKDISCTIPHPMGSSTKAVSTNTDYQKDFYKTNYNNNNNNNNNNKQHMVLLNNVSGHVQSGNLYIYYLANID